MHHLLISRVGALWRIKNVFQLNRIVYQMKSCIQCVCVCVCFCVVYLGTERKEGQESPSFSMHEM